jgi:hypothetical protein
LPPDQRLPDAWPAAPKDCEFCGYIAANRNLEDDHASELSRRALHERTTKNPNRTVGCLMSHHYHRKMSQSKSGASSPYPR